MAEGEGDEVLLREEKAPSERKASQSEFEGGDKVFGGVSLQTYSVARRPAARWCCRRYVHFGQWWNVFVSLREHRQSASLVQLLREYPVVVSFEGVDRASQQAVLFRKDIRMQNESLMELVAETLTAGRSAIVELSHSKHATWWEFVENPDALENRRCLLYFASANALEQIVAHVDRIVEAENSELSCARGMLCFGCARFSRARQYQRIPLPDDPLVIPMQ
jgi:hypothetical protein